MQPRRDRRLADAERLRRLAVGEPDDVDRDERVAEVIGQRRDRRVQLLGFEPRSGLRGVAVLDQLEVVGQRASSAAGAPAVRRRRHERVAEHPQQVADVVLGAEHARLAEHARERLLHQVLGLLARAAQAPCSPVEPVDVIAERLWIELAIGAQRPEDRSGA